MNLPPSDALLPLYMYLLAGQPKAESGRAIDAQSWLRSKSRSPVDATLRPE
jgi:hypothetical protein